jgi:hypothetical protein
MRGAGIERGGAGDLWLGAHPGRAGAYWLGWG